MGFASSDQGMKVDFGLRPGHLQETNMIWKTRLHKPGLIFETGLKVDSLRYFNRGNYVFINFRGLFT